MPWTEVRDRVDNNRGILIVFGLVGFVSIAITQLQFNGFEKRVSEYELKFEVKSGVYEEILAEAIFLTNDHKINDIHYGRVKK